MEKEISNIDNHTCSKKSLPRRVAKKLGKQTSCVQEKKTRTFEQATGDDYDDDEVKNDVPGAEELG